MKTTKFIYRLFAIVFISVLVSCSGEDGEDGMDGIDGVDGVDGADGQDGEDGEPGTANVIYSDWFDTEFTTEMDVSASSFDIDAPEIDNDMLSSGTILVFANRTSGEDLLVYQLPIVFGGARQQSFFFRASEETITISVHANEQGQGVGGGSFLEQYRYILIPGGVSTSGKASVDYTSMKYDELLDFFNIPE